MWLTGLGLLMIVWGSDSLYDEALWIILAIITIAYGLGV